MHNAWPDWISEDIHRIVSVDVETAGPNPADYALLSVGACTLGTPRKEFYVELKPVSIKEDKQASEIHQLDMDELSRSGEPPALAMQKMADWLLEVIPVGNLPLFLGFNAPFDWMFVCDYFHRFLGYNPFGHSALDIRSFYMGLNRAKWIETRMAEISNRALQHNALEDACDQAELFKQIIMGST